MSPGPDEILEAEADPKGTGRARVRDATVVAREPLSAPIPEMRPTEDRGVPKLIFGAGLNQT